MSRGLLRNTTDICADCGSLDARWASINRGVLVCDECCSVHRSLGRHVSQIKSLKKGSWNPQQLAMHHQLVSQNANSIWEHTLLDPTHNKHGRKKPTSRDPVFPNKADFIRAKYQFLAFVNKQKDTEVSCIDDLSRQLHSSVRTADLKTSIRLLSLGADPNYFHPEKGTTPLHVAALSGQALQVELLLTYGADPGMFDSNGRMPADLAKRDGHPDLADRLIEYQYELTDRIANYLCGRKPDHRNKQHFIIPEMTDSSLDLSELAKTAKSKLQALPNHLFEELAMDVYDEVDRRENEDIWLLSVVGSSTSLVSDKQTVPFLPVNPEFSATRNQGRQKLARFNKREFATLIIDILSDARRRHQGVTSQSVGISSNTYTKSGPTKAPAIPKLSNSRANKSSSIISDDEPLYDTVCSDEDYASIGDNQSLNDDSRMTNNNGEVNSVMQTPTTEQVLFYYPSSGGAGEEQRPIPRDSIAQRACSPPSDNSSSGTGVGGEQYELMRHELIKCQNTVQQVMQANEQLKQQNAKLLEELNREKTLRKQRKTPPPPEPLDPSTSSSSQLPNGHPGSGGGGGGSGTGSAGRPVSMFEARDSHRHWSKHRQQQAVVRERSSEEDRASTDSVKSRKSTSSSSTCSLHSQSAGSMIVASSTGGTMSRLEMESDYENNASAAAIAAIAAVTMATTHTPESRSSSSAGSSHRSSSCRSTSSSNMTPTDSALALSAITEADLPPPDLPPPPPPPPRDDTPLPTQEDVVRKTEKITKKIQELLRKATEDRYEGYLACAEKIQTAVKDMITLFPKSCGSRIESSLHQLSTGALRLCNQCSRPPPDVTPGHPDLRLHTQQVIQCAYDIAQAAKQLVICFE